MENKFIPLSVPNFKGNELKYVTDAVTNEWVSTGGRYIERFENMIAEYVNVSTAVACQSGTAGLHLSLLILGISAQDMVIVPSLSFIAAVNPVSYIGAEPVFMDCDDSLCIDPDKLLKFCQEECIVEDKKLIDRVTRKHIAAIIVVHIFGNMADMDKIMEIANQFHLKVIEDATEALGTYYISGRFKGKYAGTIGDVGVYSFNGNKIITTGGGGVLVARSEDMLKRARHLSTQAKCDQLNYIHDEVGYNYRMTNLQAALGVAQLEQLEEFIEIKNNNYYLYEQKIKNIPHMNLLPFRNNIRSNRWFYSVLCKNMSCSEREDAIAFLENHKIQSRPIWGLISDQVPYKQCRKYLIEKAIYYRQRVINIPCSTSLRKDNICHVVEVLNEISRQ